MGYSPSRRAAITAQSHNLLQDFRILTNLVLNDSSHRVKEIGTKVDEGQKFSSKLWLCAVMAARLLGRVPIKWCYDNCGYARADATIADDNYGRQMRKTIPDLTIADYKFLKNL